MIIGKPLFNEKQIKKRVGELADKINNHYKDKNLLALCILKGAFMFYADLLKLIKVPLTIDFLIASSYKKTETTGEVKIHHHHREPVKDTDVLLIEDIIDTGITLKYIRDMILKESPSSLKICTFLDKKETRVVDIPLDYVGFEIPDVFVVGYGTDYENQYRNLPYISIFKKEV